MRPPGHGHRSGHQESSGAAAARRMEQSQVGALAVVDEAGQLVGMVSMRDLLAVEAWM
jgi:CBS domain-containing protein